MTANGLAPVLGEIVIARAGFPAYFGTAIVFALVAVAMTLGVADRPAAAAAPQTGIVRGLVALGRSPELRRVFVASAFLGAAINAAFFFVAPFTRELGIERSGPFFLAYAGTSIVIRLFGRRALDLMGPHRVSVPGFTIFAIGLAGLALLPYVGHGAATIVLIATGIAGGAGHGSLFPVLSALAIARAPVAMQGAVVSLHTAALDLGAVLGTPLCGAIADRAGYPTMYMVMGICCWVGLILMVTDPLRGLAHVGGLLALPARSSLQPRIPTIGGNDLHAPVDPIESGRDGRGCRTGPSFRRLRTRLARTRRAHRCRRCEAAPRLRVPRLSNPRAGRNDAAPAHRRRVSFSLAQGEGRNRSAG
jgi:hypothetical protein